MIGNDIVDLKPYQAEPRSDKQKFLDRVLTPNEMDSLGKIAFPRESLLWVYWSLKESAYKAIFKEKKPAFGPKQFDCSLTSMSGKKVFSEIQTPKGLVWGESKVTDQYIFSKVTRAYTNLAKVSSKVFIYDKADFISPSQTIRKELAIELAKKGLEIDINQFSYNQFGTPMLNSYSQTDIDFSFSHHGHWLAYTYFINTKEVA